MKTRSFFFALSILSFIATTACNNSAKTTLMPLGSSGGSSGFTQAASVMLNETTNASYTSSTASIAFNNAGYGMAVWESNTGSYTRTLYSIFNPTNGTWSEAAELFGDTDGPCLASNGTGFMVAFRAGSAIWSISWSGGSWGTLTKISTSSGYCYSPQIATNGSGYCVVWQQYKSSVSAYNSYAAVHNGTSWGAVSELHDSTFGSSYQRVVSNGDGYCATWMDTGNRLYASVYSTGSWSAAAAVDNGTGYPWNYEVAGSASRYILVFAESNSIYANVYNGGWGGSADIDNGAGSAYQPRITSNGTSLCAVWYQHDGIRYNVYSRIYTTSWGSVTELDANNNSAQSPAIVSDGSGYCTVWIQYDTASSLNKVFANRYETGAWQGAEIVNTAGSYDASGPAVFSNGASYLAYWNESDGTAARLQASLYSSGWGAQAIIDAGELPNSYIRTASFTGGYGLCLIYDDTQVDIYGNVYTGGAWTGTSDLIIPRGNGSCLVYSDPPSKIFRAGSSLVAIWSQRNNWSISLYACVKDGSSWGEPILFSNQINEFSAASNGSEVYIVWTHYSVSSSNQKISGRGYSNGAWGTERDFYTDASYWIYSPMVAGNNSADDFCVVWRRRSGSYNRLYASTRTALTGDWSAPQQMDDLGVTNEVYPYVMKAGDDNYCIIFNQDSHSYANVYDSGWIGAEIIDNGNEFWTNELAVSGNNFLTTWYEYSSNNIVYTRLYDGSWNASETHNTVATNNAYYPVVAGNGSGFCLAWAERASSNDEIIARIYNGATWEDPEGISAFMGFSSGSDAISPMITSNGDGYVVVFIQDDLFQALSLYANVFDGSWLGAELLEEGLDDIGSGEYMITSDGIGYGIVWPQVNNGLVYAYGTKYVNGSWSRYQLSNGDGNASYPTVTGASGKYTGTFFQRDKDDSLVDNIWAAGF